ncbi:acyl-CoA dehydrogenase [Rhodopila globiformis]|nr:acyl-CoA dehydrogenase [Rhodopila globiformis]
MNDRIAAWLARCPDPATDPLPGMREAGLLEPVDDYAAIARGKAALVEATRLLGIAGVWGGRHLVYRHFLGFGPPAQREAWRGRALAVAISEPNVGAHPKLLTTRAERVDGGFRLAGQKAWVTNGPSADAIIVFAITAEEAGRKRYGAFIVPRDTPGLAMADMPGFHALRPSRHCLLTLDACFVPDAALLGEPGSAYDRMALPFRDIEDAVGSFATLGALRHAIGLCAGGPAEQAEALGAVVALTAVFAAGAQAVVAALDAGSFRTGDATLVGLRLLATDIVARLRAMFAGMTPPPVVMAATRNKSPGTGSGPPSTPGDAGSDPVADSRLPIPGQGHVSPGARQDDPLAAILSDLDATLGIARGPRLARQVQLGAAALRGGGGAP